MASPPVSLKLKNAEDPKEVLEALKKEGIASLDDLVKNGLEALKQKGGLQSHAGGVFKSPENHVFIWTGM